MSKEDSLKAYKIKRASIIGQQTLIRKYSETVTNSASVFELETKLDLLESYADKFDLVQSEIEILDEEELDNGKRETFIDIYCTIKSKLMELISKKKPSAGSNGNNHDSTSFILTNKRAKLKELEIIKFSGKIIDWPDFYESFKTNIDDDTEMPSFEKFQRLKNCLDDNTRRCIDNMKMNDSTYTQVLEMLKRRFANKRLIFQAHIKELFKLQKVLDKGSTSQLRLLIDKANAHIRALKTLCTSGKEKEQICDGLLVHLIGSKLDINTRSKWEEKGEPENIPTWEKMFEFIEKRCQTLESIDSAMDNEQDKNKQSSNFVKGTNMRKVSLIGANPQRLCSLCSSNDHFIANCSNFVQLTPKSRFNEAKRLKLCLNCLRPGHIVKNCSSRRCSHCSSKHNSLLHLGPAQSSQNANLVSPSSSSRFTSTSFDNNQQLENPNRSSTVLKVSHQDSNIFDSRFVILATTIVSAQDSNGAFIPCRALLDSGSQFHFVTEKVAQQLRIKRSKFDIPIEGIGSICANLKYKGNLVIRSRINDFSVNINVAIIPKITGSHPEAFVNTDDWNIPSNCDLADPKFNVPEKVDLLIGAGLFFDLLCVGQIRLGEHLPTMQKTRLGWIVSGEFNQSQLYRYRQINALMSSSSSDNLANFDQSASIDNILERFWEIESHTEVINKWSEEEVNCENHFLSNFIRDSHGGFIVSLPFRRDPTCLGDSLEIAKRRFFNLERKLGNNKDLLKQYSLFMEEYLNLNHMERVAWEHMADNHYVIPHHCVLKPESSSTKLRVVFDASCVTSTGESLNNILMVGPTIQSDLCQILLRFRSHRFAITSDVSKMYRRVRLDERDSHFQYILWRDSPYKPLELYKLNTVTYGTASASFLAIRSVVQLAREEISSFPIAAQIIQNDLYVDDMLTGADTIDQAIEICKQVNSLLERGNFSLHKWCSNNDEILEQIDANLRETFLNINEKNVIKTLGMTWQPELDNFRFFYKIADVSKAKITKRSVLSCIGRLFDPLGLINPVIVQAQIFMKELWKSKLNWDESLPQHLYSYWIKFIEQLPAVEKISIPRYVIFRSSSIELHGFADASMNAYGACIYSRCIDSFNNVSVNLLSAKSRIAPAKTESIPRLELCAALLLSELLNRVIDGLSLDIQQSVCWSDSSIVLAWISSPAYKWAPFVSNRVTKIQKLTEKFHWRHILSHENPADIVSRGASPNELLSSQLWFHGPLFLQNVAFVNESNEVYSNIVVPEQRKTKTVLIASKHNTEDLVINNKYINSFAKLVRIFGYIIRWRTEIKKPKEERKFSEITFHDTENGLLAIIKNIQKHCLEEEYSLLTHNRQANEEGSQLVSLPNKTKIRNLNPFIDENDIIRVGGRLRFSDITFDSKHQILLPNSHPFTKALISYYHIKNEHAGIQTLLSIIRTRFWPINGKNMVKGIIHKCIRCYRAKPVTLKQIMGELPSSRVKPSRAFSHTGVDFCGPFFVSQNIRGRAPVKSYICIYVCFSVKAVHFEIVSNLSTDAFIASLKRFIARRGRPTVIYSDNATNFVGANNKLKELKRLFASVEHQEHLKNVCISDSIEWKFIPPKSPHFGGLWESSVKLAKYHLKRVVGERILNIEEFTTFICQVEAIVNSRPLTPISNDPNDFNILTPAHFLIGESLRAIPEPDLKNYKINRLTRWQQLTQMKQHFWSRWNKEYLQSLQTRNKWFDPAANIKINMLVILKDDNLPPLKWELGRIIEVFPGRDKQVRVAAVKTQNGIFKRTITKLCPLPLDD